jgi:tRNA(fMet)-specific endonuclease VapC
VKRIVLDAYAYIALFGGDRRVLAALSTAETVYVPAIVLGELRAGLDATTQGMRRRKDLATFLSKPTVEVVAVGDETAEFYGRIVAGLKRNGTPIPINDAWIAANAFETGSSLVTYDRHFAKVPGLLLWDEFPA